MPTPRRVSAATKVKKQYQATVDFIEERAPLWQERMGLSHFEIEHHYLDAGSELVIGARPKNRPGVVRCGFGATGELAFTACVETRWNYQLADVYFFLPRAIEWAEKRLDQIIVHEYAHVMCAPEQYLLELKLAEVASAEEMASTDFDILASLYYERMEMATENVARAVYDCAPARFKVR